MTDRRAFLAGMLATGLAPVQSWADIGTPAFLSAARMPSGAYKLFGIRSNGGLAFSLPLPSRGHAAAAHPMRAEAVAFARRPGTFALVLDCVSGAILARLDAPAGRHFYGHGAFSADGHLLFTTENDYAAARGRVGIWDAQRGYKRLGDVGSGGIGPHEIKLMPDGQSLVVANGGIETHPETGRAKLNLATMRPNLSYIDLNGTVLDQLELPAEHRKNSIRHLAVTQDGTVAFAMQWQGDLTADLPLLGLHTRAEQRLHLADATHVRAMRGYLGSVAASANGALVVTTSPRSGRAHVYRGTDLIAERSIADVCGVAVSGPDVIFTSGNGALSSLHGQIAAHAVQWDNHLIQI